MSDGPILGLDVGSRRIGVAISDFNGLLAAPLTTIKAEPPERALERIIGLAREREVNAIVIGLPLTLRGEIGPQAEIVRRFGDTLAAAIDLPLHYFDERLTSSAAEQMLRDMGMKAEKRRQQIDQVAASIILQDFLDHRRSRK
ncbi:MAG: Holliday junction resolvase RuvX [Oscillochloris sp.]|nr:Holliday junction resolvase RuvX [Oscillochloris sp.]